MQIHYDDLEMWIGTFVQKNLPKSAPNQRLDSFGSWREYASAPADDLDSNAVGVSFKQACIPQKLLINVTAEEGKRRKYIDILPLLLLNLERRNKFKCIVLCGGENHWTKLWPYRASSEILQTEFTGKALSDSLSGILFHDNAIWKEKLSACSYALFDLYHTRHLVMVFKPGEAQGVLRSKSAQQACIRAMGFGNSAIACGFLNIDMHPYNEFTGLEVDTMGQVEDVQEAEDEDEQAIEEEGQQGSQNDSKEESKDGDEDEEVSKIECGEGERSEDDEKEKSEHEDKRQPKQEAVVPWRSQRWDFFSCKSTHTNT